MKKYILIYDIVRNAEKEFKSHYRIYDEDKNLLIEDNYSYFIRKPRKFTIGQLKQKISNGIKQKETGLKRIDKKHSFSTACLVSNKVLQLEVEDMNKSREDVKKTVEIATNRIEVEEDPRIFKVVLINGNYTIVKSESKYLTREQAKEELFRRQLEEA